MYNAIEVDGLRYGIYAIREIRDQRDAYRELLIQLMKEAPMRTFVSENFLCQMSGDELCIFARQSDEIIVHYTMRGSNGQESESSDEACEVTK